MSRPAYVIGHVTVKDPQRWAEYRNGVPATPASDAHRETIRSQLRSIGLTDGEAAAFERAWFGELFDAAAATAVQFGLLGSAWTTWVEDPPTRAGAPPPVPESGWSGPSPERRKDR